jgi:hypothetical protein
LRRAKRVFMVGGSKLMAVESVAGSERLTPVPTIAARQQSDPGGTLGSGAAVDAVSVCDSARCSTFDDPPTAEAIAIFGEAIAVHLGPVGRVMTARKAKSCASLADLLAALEKEIPTPTEQHIFRSRIKRQFEP